MTAEQIRRIEEDGGKLFRAVVMSMSMSSQSAHSAVQNADGLGLMTDGREFKVCWIRSFILQL